MKKTGILFLIVAVLLTASVVALMGCSLFKDITVDEAKSNLESAGYEVTVMTGAEYDQLEEPPYPSIQNTLLVTYLTAKKGNDVIHMFFYDTINQAESAEAFLSDPDLLSGQSNKVIYLATRQARKDAKL